MSHATFEHPRAQRTPHVAPGAIDVHAADMAVVAGADVTLAQVNAELAKASPPQWLPLDGPGDLPLRDLVHHDSTGPLRAGFGGWRDRLTGAQYLDGHGDLVTVGGLPVKNVAGYDLVRFLVGSHGCFGTATTLTIRTDRRPEAAMLAKPAVDASNLAAFVNHLLTSDAPPQWMIYDTAGGGGLRCGWLGSTKQLNALRADVVRVTNVEPTFRIVADDNDDRANAMRWPRERRAKLFVPPTAVAGVIERFASMGFSDVAADPVFGVVWCDAGAVPKLLPLLVETGGHALIFEGIHAATKRPRLAVLNGGAEPPAEQQQLKRRLDPTAALPPLPTYR